MIDLRLGRWQDVLADVTTCDAVICDPPYSARTHEGHDKGTDQASGHARRISYTSWTPDDVEEFVLSWAPRCRGWMVCFTSHDLSSTYTSAYERAGLYAFSPLPWYCPGSRVRLSGDGPSSWTCWIMVARPRHEPYSRWGTLPGGYQTRPEDCPVVGGKPLGLMRAIVRDYSRPGDLVVDPFAGGGTTALACRAEGRRCITSEAMPEHYEIARKRIEAPSTLELFGG